MEKTVSDQMSSARCEICNQESRSLFIVTHRERGRIKICEACLKNEADRLMAHKSCSCC